MGHAQALRELGDELYASRRNGGIKGAVQPRLIDLFAGAGGLSLGFSSHFGHRFKHVWANDSDPAAVATYNRNFGPVCQPEDINDLLADKRVPEADVVVGGPPCQGFSLLNKNREGDPRSDLWKPFLEVVRRSGARVFVMENVPQLLGSPQHRQIIEEAKIMGFRVVSSALLAADYGVPQTRTRAFLLGAKDADPNAVFPPRPTHFEPVPTRQVERSADEARPWRTVRDAIGDLPPPFGTELRKEPAPLDLHFGRNPTELSRKRYRAIPDEGMNRFDLQKRALELTPACWIRKKSGGTDLFGRLWWDRPAFTIRTEFFKPEKGRYLHPEQHRPITHREAARFQTFPDHFTFEGKKIDIARHIGNAVPPVLAARLADAVLALIVGTSKAEAEV